MAYHPLYDHEYDTIQLEENGHERWGLDWGTPIDIAKPEGQLETVTESLDLSVLTDISFECEPGPESVYSDVTCWGLREKWKDHQTSGQILRNS